MLQRTLENLKKINEILLTVGELGLGIYLAKHLYELDKKKEKEEKEREESLEEQYREALRAVRERLSGAGAESGSEQEEHLFM